MEALPTSRTTSPTTPGVAVEFLARILARMAAGQGVSVVPFHAETPPSQGVSLLAYLRADDQHRRSAADELSGLTQQMLVQPAAHPRPDAAHRADD